jgi:hypothetical protein
MHYGYSFGLALGVFVGNFFIYLILPTPRSLATQLLHPEPTIGQRAIKALTIGTLAGMLTFALALAFL